MPSLLFNNLYKLTLVCLVFAMLAPPLARADDFVDVDFRGDWGIEPVMLRTTADGYMVEFRYRVVDPVKARVLSNNKEFPRLKAMKSQARLAVPFFGTVGYIKSNRRFLKQGKNYTTMFSNENRHLISGDKVRIQVGNQQSPELTVE